MSITKGEWTVVAVDQPGRREFWIAVNQNCIARVTRVMADVGEAEANAQLIASAPKTKRDHDKLLEACKAGPAPNIFAMFAHFAEECAEKPSMAIYKTNFIAMATFLNSCVDRSEKALQAIAESEV